jgi:hypothetical protein
MAVTELEDLQASVGRVQQAGVTPLLVQPSTFAEWDDYEWALIREIELWSREEPGSPDVGPFLEQTRLMRDTYLSWRRDAFGFVLVAGVVGDAAARS